jgi:hypothetical protein
VYGDNHPSCFLQSRVPKHHLQQQQQQQNKKDESEQNRLNKR